MWLNVQVNSDQPVALQMWFDPICPFAWITSRWLVELEELGVAVVTWRPMSLALTNEHEDVPEEWQEAMDASRRGARVGVVIERNHGAAAIGRYYAAIGSRVHVDGRPFDLALVSEALAEAGLPAGVADAWDDASLDEVVRAVHDLGQQAVGERAGSPIVAIGDRGFLGPVLTSIPRGDDAVRLLRGFEALCSTPGLAEVKRARDEALVTT